MSIKILTLGGPAAGKTVYLASLYKKLAIQNNDPNSFYQFCLRTSDRDNGRFLTSTFANIVDPNKDFPSGTRELTHWNFDCQVKSKNQVYSVCQFDYLDYAGGIINQQSSQSGQEENIKSLNKSIENADAIFVLLDGVKIFHLLSGNNKADGLHKWLHEDIANILDDLQDINIPIYFAITKWDCLQSKYSLKEIGEKLKEFERFKNFIDNFSHDRESIIRLIPISSLGDGFAEMIFGIDGDIKGIKKTGKLKITPYNVEIPIAYALIDTLITRYNKKIKEEKSKLFFLRLFGLSTDFLPFPLDSLGSQTVEKIINNLQNQMPPVDNNKKIDLLDIKSEAQAIKHLIDCFWYLTKKFENDYPSSILNHPTWHYKN